MSKGIMSKGVQELSVDTYTVSSLQFTVAVLVILGFYHAVIGYVALLQPDLYIMAESELLVFDFNVWGWAHVLLGGLFIVVAIGLFAKKSWAKVTAILLLGLSAIANFIFLPTSPLWSILMIAVDLLAIYTVTAHHYDSSK